MPHAVSSAKGGSKKGAQKYQNSFAFKHNAKSKISQKINAMPNDGVCNRCFEQIEWRKKFKKYKPLAQPKKWCVLLIFIPAFSACMTSACVRLSADVWRVHAQPIVCASITCADLLTHCLWVKNRWLTSACDFLPFWPTTQRRLPAKDHHAGIPRHLRRLRSEEGRVCKVSPEEGACGEVCVCMCSHAVASVRQHAYVWLLLLSSTFALLSSSP